MLLWREDGSVYWMASGTPKKVSVRGMRATAAGLDHLGANYGGSYFVPGSNNSSLGATLVTTRHFISGVIEWGTDNCTSNGFPAAAHGGSAGFFMLPLRSGAFSMPLTEGWRRQPLRHGLRAGGQRRLAGQRHLRRDGVRHRPDVGVG